MVSYEHHFFLVTDIVWPAYDAFPVCIYYVFTVCIYCVITMYLLCILSVYLLCINCIFTVCINCVFPVCIYCVFNVYLLCVSCVILQASSLETKQLWIKRLRELIQERLIYISSALNKGPMFRPPPPKMFNQQRASRSVACSPLLIRSTK